MHSVAINSEACAVRIFFFGSVVYEYSTIGDVPPAINGQLLFVNEKHRVCAFDLACHSLRYTDQLFGVGLCVELAVFWVLHEATIFHQLFGVFV